MGDVLDALEQSGKLNDTIIVLWSDHGWHLGEKNHWRKTTLWQEMTRNLLSISVSEMSTPGAECHRTVDSLDLLPTLCELAGLPIPKHVEGDTLVLLLEKPFAKWGHPASTIPPPR